jgi:hypothetical protein
MQASPQVTVSKSIPQELLVAANNPLARLDNARGIKAAAWRVLVASNVIPQEVVDGRDRRRDSVERADALTAAFARELEDILKEVFEAEYPELRAAEFLPERFVSPDAATFTYRMTNKVGVADIIDDNGNNMPKVDVDGQEWQQPVVSIGCSYDFTYLDQMRSARLGVSVDALKAEAARYAIELKIEQLAANGDSTQGLVGLWNAPGVSATTQLSTGTWVSQINAIGSASTSNATPPAVVVAQALIADVAQMKRTIYQNTLGIHVPDTMLVPTSIYMSLEATPRSPGYTDDTLLQYMEKITGLDIEMWPQLNAADTAGHSGVHGVVVVYKKDPKIVNLMQAMPFTQIAPQPIRLAWEIPCWARTGAAQVRYPLAVSFMYGLG